MATNTVSQLLTTSLLGCQGIGPNRQLVLKGASADFTADVYAARTPSGRTVRVASINGSSRPAPFLCAAPYLKYTVTAGSIGSGSIWIQGPNGQLSLGSRAIALSTSAVDVSRLAPGTRQLYIVGAPLGLNVSILVSNSTSGNFTTLTTLIANAAGTLVYNIPDDASVAMKYAIVVGTPTASTDIFVAGGEEYHHRAAWVATSIGANSIADQILTITATGALGNQDGATPAVGNVGLFPLGLSNVDTTSCGPWEVLTLGDTTSSPTFMRPGWWQQGAAMLPSGLEIYVGSDGSLFGDTVWRNGNSTGAVIGTDDPRLFPRLVSQIGTLSTGAITVTNVPIAATKSSIRFERTAVGGTVTSTVQYNQSALTPGALGTASATIQAQTSTGAVQTSDTSTGRIVIENQ